MLYPLVADWKLVFWSILTTATLLNFQLLLRIFSKRILHVANPCPSFSACIKGVYSLFIFDNKCLIISILHNHGLMITVHRDSCWPWVVLLVYVWCSFKSHYPFSCVLWPLNFNIMGTLWHKFMCLV